MFEFEVDYDLRAPEPFDRELADLRVQASSNNFEDGVELLVSAQFGSEVIRINLDDGAAIEATGEIFQARVITEPVNCRFANIENEQDHQGFLYEQVISETTSRTKKLGRGINGEVGVQLSRFEATTGVRVRGSADSDVEIKAQTSITAKKRSPQVEFGHGIVRIRPNPSNSPLIGNLINAIPCMKVVPIDPSMPFGIVSRLQVRREWMALKDPEAISMTDRLYGLIERAFGEERPEDRFHKDAFNLLLNELVFRGLQTDRNDQYATLAGAAIRMLPVNIENEEPSISISYIAPIRRKITLPLHDIERVLSGDRSLVDTTLRKYHLTSPKKYFESAKAPMFFSPDAVKTEFESVLVEQVSRDFFGNAEHVIVKIHKEFEHSTSIENFGLFVARDWFKNWMREIYKKVGLEKELTKLERAHGKQSNYTRFSVKEGKPRLPKVVVIVSNGGLMAEVFSSDPSKNEKHRGRGGQENFSSGEFKKR